MRYTVHVVRSDGQLYLVDCGLTNACATDLIQRLENRVFKVRVDIAGSINEPTGWPVRPLSSLITLLVPLPSSRSPLRVPLSARAAARLEDD